MDINLDALPSRSALRIENYENNNLLPKNSTGPALKIQGATTDFGFVDDLNFNSDTVRVLKSLDFPPPANNLFVTNDNMVTFFSLENNVYAVLPKSTIYKVGDRFVFNMNHSDSSPIWLYFFRGKTVTSLAVPSNAESSVSLFSLEKNSAAIGKFQVRNLINACY